MQAKRSALSGDHTQVDGGEIREGPTSETSAITGFIARIENSPGRPRRRELEVHAVVRHLHDITVEPDGNDTISLMLPETTSCSSNRDVTRTVMPCLDVLGADMTRIDYLPRDGDRLPTDADFGATFGAVRAAEAKLVVVLDPLPSIVSPSGASCTDQELRSTLAKLARLAARTRAAVLGTRDLHAEKEGHLWERGDGIRNISGVWTRLVAGPNPADNRRSVLRRIASDRSTTSVAPLQFAMAVNATGVPSIAWSTPPHAHESSRRLTRRRRQGRPALDGAVKFLRELLADGPVSVAEVAQAADSAGMKMPTVRRAKSQLEVESKKRGQPGSDIQAWMWVLPEGDPLRQS